MERDTELTQMTNAYATAEFRCRTLIDVAVRSCCRVSCALRSAIAACCFAIATKLHHVENTRSRDASTRFCCINSMARWDTRDRYLYWCHASNVVATTRCCSRTTNRSAAHFSLRSSNVQSCHVASTFDMVASRIRHRAFCRRLVRTALDADHARQANSTMD